MPLPRRSIQLLMVVAMAITACKKSPSAPIPDGDVTATLPRTLSDDKPFDPASLKGKPSLVMFASPTCGYCLKEMPLAQNAAKAKDGNALVVFVSGAKKDGLRVASRVGFTGPVLHDDGTLKKRYAITGVPYTVVLKPDGTASTAFGGTVGESELAEALADAR